MKKFPKPWFRPTRGLWYVTIDGHQHNLGPNRDEAFRRYHEMMARPERRRVAANSLLAVIDAFLEWSQKHRSAATYEWYRSRLEMFVRSIPADLRADELRPLHVQQWIDGCHGVSSGTRRNYCRSIQRALHWAEQQGYIDRSPIAHMEKPPGGKREMVLSVDEFQSILAVTRDREFRDLLWVTWETGCRPQESLRLEARHVDLANSRWVLPQSEEKMGRIPRVIYLTETALEITERLLHTYPVGRLLRNTRGVAWTTDAVNCRFGTLKKKLGKRYCLYALRHTWMNRLLTSGVDGITVAVLAGHADTSTLARTYQHLSQNPTYLRQQLGRLTA
jgi:integrase